MIGALVATGALGASVTIPHKEAALAACTRVDPLAARTGAVNCLVFDLGEVVGYNTDAGGFVDALAEANIAASGRAILLGGGGAARAVAAGLADAGADVTVVARRPDAVTWCTAAAWSELPSLLESAALVVDCTSAGLAADTDVSLADSVPLERLPPSAAVVTLVYHRATELCRRAAERGLVTMDGKGMLLHQGVRAFKLWTGRAAPVDVMRAALAAAE